MAPMGEDAWRRKLDGSDQGARPLRRFWRSLPLPPRCKMCLRPFAGPGGAVMRMISLGPWHKNPKFCRGCYQAIDAHRGGAEVELSMLFADVRGSTGMAERMTPSAFTDLLNRFYAVASRELVARDAVVDKFVGDEVVGLFIPGMAGLDHARVAIDAARALLRETGHGAPGGPWIPVGAGVHTGVAFVGSIGGGGEDGAGGGGEGGVTDFTALGDAVNATARLASLAGPGEILVTDSAADAAGVDPTGLERRHLELRGRAEPMDVVVLRGGAEVPVGAGS
jgi:adenylate cyclase